jgi:hypothetical protein
LEITQKVAVGDPKAPSSEGKALKKWKSAKKSL